VACRKRSHSSVVLDSLYLHAFCLTLSPGDILEGLALMDAIAGDGDPFYEVCGTWLQQYGYRVMVMAVCTERCGHCNLFSCMGAYSFQHPAKL
jgi:hypothetical protein